MENKLYRTDPINFSQQSTLIQDFILIASSCDYFMSQVLICFANVHVVFPNFPSVNKPPDYIYFISATTREQKYDTPI